MSKLKLNIFIENKKKIQSRCDVWRHWPSASTLPLNSTQKKRKKNQISTITKTLLSFTTGLCFVTWPADRFLSGDGQVKRKWSDFRRTRSCGTHLTCWQVDAPSWWRDGRGQERGGKSKWTEAGSLWFVCLLFLLWEPQRSASTRPCAVSVRGPPAVPVPLDPPVLLCDFSPFVAEVWSEFPRTLLERRRLKNGGENLVSG